MFPLSVDKTLVRTKWLVAADAVEGVDYNLDDLTKVWNQTNLQDQSLAEGTYRGICSGGYQPGPLPMRNTSLSNSFPGIPINSLKPLYINAKNCNHRSRHRWLLIGRRTDRTRIYGCNGDRKRSAVGARRLYVACPRRCVSNQWFAYHDQFAQQTVEKLYSLQYNGEPCFLKVGSLELATTPERLADLHRRAGLAISVGIHAKVISAEEALRMHPMLAKDTLLGALYVPDDGIARAKLGDQLMGERAISRGATFVQNCEVTAIDQSDGRVTGVQTTQGSYAADIVVSCAGIYGDRRSARWWACIKPYNPWRTSSAIPPPWLN